MGCSDPPPLARVHKPYLPEGGPPPSLDIRAHIPKAAPIDKFRCDKFYFFRFSCGRPGLLGCHASRIRCV
eukprot:scaffold578_cov167-Amphora_coffeaeformis.AAC.27